MNDVIAITAVSTYMVVGAIIGAIGGTSVGNTISRIGGGILVFAVIILGFCFEVFSCISSSEVTQMQVIHLVLCVSPRTILLLLVGMFLALLNPSLGHLFNIYQDKVSVVTCTIGGLVGGYGAVLSGIDPLNVYEGLPVVVQEYAGIGGAIIGMVIGILNFASNMHEKDELTYTIEKIKRQALEDAIETIKVLAEPSSLIVAQSKWHTLSEQRAPAGYVIVLKSQKWLILREFSFVTVFRLESPLVVFGSGRAEYKGKEVVAVFKTPQAELLESHLYKRFAPRHQRGEWFGLVESDLEKIRSY